MGCAFRIRPKWPIGPISAVPQNPNTRKHAKYQKLLDSPDVKEWLRAANPSVRSSNFRRLGLICETFDVTPKQLCEMTEKQAFSFLLRVKEHYETAGKSGTYIESLLKNTKSWLAHNDIKITKKIHIKKVEKRERVPTNTEVRSMLAEAKVRAKAAICLVGFAGLRPEVLGTFDGKDGLKLADLPELIQEGGKLGFSHIPTQIIVRQEISKAGHEYISFLNKEGCNALLQYLQTRKGLGPESPVITADPQREEQFGKHVVTKSIGVLIRNPIRKAGFKFRPYIFRRYFHQRLYEAQGSNISDSFENFRKFWEGHKGSISEVYTTNKGVEPVLLEQMRAAYKAADERYLSTESVHVAQKDVRTEVYREMLGAFSDMDPKEIDMLDLANMKAGDFKKLIGTSVLDTLMAPAAEAKGKLEPYGIKFLDEKEVQSVERKFVSEKELLNLGPDWAIRFELRGGKFLVERPTIPKDGWRGLPKKG